MKPKLFTLIFGVVLGLTCFVQKAQAQKFYNATFALDTLTNTDNTGNLYASGVFKDNYTVSFQVFHTNISGTTAGNIYVQKSNAAAGNYWTNTDTIAVSGTGSKLIELNITSARYRIYVVSSGTGVTQYRAFAAYRKNEDGFDVE